MSIDCSNHESVEQTFKILYKAICSGEMCTKESQMKFKSRAYKRGSIVLDFSLIVLIVIFYFYKTNQPTIIEAVDYLNI